MAASITILGAGPSGLIAAWHAARAGHEVTVLERNANVGGMAASFRVAGQSVDHGSHRLHRSIDPVLLGELQSLLGDDLQWRPRSGRIRLADSWLGFPLRPLGLLHGLPPRLLVSLFADALLRRPLDEESYASFIGSTLGPTMLDRFYGPYASKLWGLEPEEVDVEQARRRVSQRSLSSIAKAMLRRSLPDGFWYPVGGFGQIPDALAHAARDAGTKFELNRSASKLSRVESGWEIATDTGPLRSQYVWSTIPLTTLARLLSPPNDVTRAIETLSFRAMTLVYLVADTDRYTKFDAHYFPEGSTRITRLSEPKNYRHDAKLSGQTVLCAELPSDVNDEVWNASDEELASLVLDDLRRSQLPSVDVKEVVVRRLPHAYPVYRCGFTESLAPVQTFVDAQPDILSFGRLGTFAHDNTHHAMAMGAAAAEALCRDGLFDSAHWERSRQRFLAHVVED